MKPVDETASAAANRYAWVARAACLRSPALRRELEGFNGSSISGEALALCEVCPVRVECLRHAYDLAIEFGYFGGLSPSRRSQFDTVEECVEWLVAEARLPPSALARVRDPHPPAAGSGPGALRGPGPAF